MNNTPKSNRPHIAIFGRRNVGKSSFINAFLKQELSIVSAVAGTTTDPVEKSFELLPFGPVVLIDTAGLDDEGELGQKRIAKTLQVLKRTDVALLLVEPEKLHPAEEIYLQQIQQAKSPCFVIINKTDTISAEQLQEVQAKLAKQLGPQIPILTCSALTGAGLDMAKEKLVEFLENLSPTPPLVADLLFPPAHVVLVVPIDKEAPKGRLILPQVQTLRELLDADVSVTVVKEKELKYTLDYQLKVKPNLVITDSQVFLKVAADVPEDVPLTSFSILMARQKGDLSVYVQGLKAIATLQNNDKILISELCSHRPISEDIGRVKIPRWLTSYTGLNLQFDVVSGKDFPLDVSAYKLIIQCGGCMVNRREILSRIQQAKAQNVPITNYGLTIAHLHGILPRAILPFPETEGLSNL